MDKGGERPKGLDSETGGGGRDKRARQGFGSEFPSDDAGVGPGEKEISAGAGTTADYETSHQK